MSYDISSKTVFVGLSGGVDSSVAALRLQRAGFNVVGVFIKVWQPDFLQCDWEQERLDAMRVAAHLQIPFLTCDAETAYKQHVGDYFVEEYLAGRTPNPDVLCNRFVKFGAFWDFAKERGADYIATGHYARVANTQNANSKNQNYKLLRGKDENKDQSYFLWTLTQADLERTLFPIGNTSKDKIRKEAEKAGLPTAVKKDSQGICFLGHIDIPEFLSHFTTLKSGAVQDTEGNIIGEHQGALVYTLGQRHGFTVFGEVGTKPHFVVEKNIKTNVLTVCEKLPQIDAGKGIKLDKVNWIQERPDNDSVLEAVFRYRGQPVKIKMEAGDALTPLADIEKPASGQSVVFYRKDVCLGGGVIV